MLAAGDSRRLAVPHPARWVCPQGVRPECRPNPPPRGRLEGVRAPDEQGAPARGARPGRGRCIAAACAPKPGWAPRRAAPHRWPPPAGLPGLAKVRGSASSRGRRVPGSPAPRRRNPGLGRALATQLSPPPPAAPPPSAASPAEAAAAGAERAPGVRDSAGRGCGLRQGWRLSLSIPGREVANGGDYRSSLRLRWCRSCPPLPRGTLRSGMRLAGLGAPRRWLPELPGGC